MAIDPRKAEVAKIVCEQFIAMRKGTPRHPLVVRVKDSSVIDQMKSQTLLREVGNTVYFPTLGTFALLPDDDPTFISARLGTIQVLHTLRNLFEVEGSTVTYTSARLLEAVSERYPDPSPRTVSLGLYLIDFPMIGAIQTYMRTKDELEMMHLVVSERVMMIDEPESLWQKCVDLSRGNAQAPETLLQQQEANRETQQSAPRSTTARQKTWLPEGWTGQKPIGEGGQGWTYKVRRSSEEDGEWFVFKRLKNASRADRFEAEIKALRNLNHPNILHIVEDGIHDGKPYYVAEFCQNGDLAKRSPQGATIIENLTLFRKICDAISAAHKAKIIHRDIKPSNILLRSDGSIAVGDFGLCLHLDSEERLTALSEAVGPRNFMAPELEDGRRDDVTPAADVYSLGKLLYFLSTGTSFSREKHREPPYDLTRSIQGQPEDPVHFVYEILDRSVVERPEARHQDAGALVAAVDVAIRKVVLNAHTLNMRIRQPCMYCIDGEYQPLATSQSDQYRMTFVCRRCGNIQQFGPPHNGWDAWWMKR